MFVLVVVAESEGFEGFVRSLVAARAAGSGLPRDATIRKKAGAAPLDRQLIQGVVAVRPSWFAPDALLLA